jgi:hypothetical protein
MGEVLEAAKDQKTDIYVRVFVVLLPVYSQGERGGGWKEQNQPQTEVKRPAWSIARGFGTKIFV